MTRTKNDKALKRRARQVAALPVRVGAAGPEVLLVTSRDTGRWIAPKGWQQRGVTGADMAAREAYEEAGVRGAVAAEPLATYQYAKRLKGERLRACEVDVHLLQVEEELADWPERQQRQRRWFTPDAAASATGEPGLVEVLRSLGGVGDARAHGPHGASAVTGLD
ncbi:MAG: NUDIX domain-containing protein [Geminicoccaceae bacterium]|nr:MAG: NUDIX domain-containing protein [Geminicoccaceae bacterium]